MWLADPSLAQQTNDPYLSAANAQLEREYEEGSGIMRRRRWWPHDFVVIGEHLHFQESPSVTHVLLLRDGEAVPPKQHRSDRAHVFRLNLAPQQTASAPDKLVLAAPSDSALQLWLWMLGQAGVRVSPTFSAAKPHADDASCRSVRIRSPTASEKQRGTSSEKHRSTFSLSKRKAEPVPGFPAAPKGGDAAAWIKASWKGAVLALQTHKDGRERTEKRFDRLLEELERLAAAEGSHAGAAQEGHDSSAWRERQARLTQLVTSLKAQDEESREPTTPVEDRRARRNARLKRDLTQTLSSKDDRICRQTDRETDRGTSIDEPSLFAQV